MHPIALSRHRSCHERPGSCARLASASQAPRQERSRDEKQLERRRRDIPRERTRRGLCAGLRGLRVYLLVFACGIVWPPRPRESRRLKVPGNCLTVGPRPPGFWEPPAFFGLSSVRVYSWITVTVSLPYGGGASPGTRESGSGDASVYPGRGGYASYLKDLALRG